MFERQSLTSIFWGNVRLHELCDDFDDKEFLGGSI